MKASMGEALPQRRRELSVTVLVNGTTADSLRRSGVPAGTTGVMHAGSSNVAGSTDLGRIV